MECLIENNKFQVKISFYIIYKYRFFSMHLKLGKSFPLLKFKPDVLKTLHLDSDLLTNKRFDINDPIHSFEDLMKLDCHLTSLIDEIKICSQIYIESVKAAIVVNVDTSIKELTKKLEILLKFLQKLDFQNIERDISEIFRGPFGLFTLYRYTWNPKLLLLIMKIKQGFEQKQEKEGDGQIQAYSKKFQKYCEAIEEVMTKEGKVILKQFIREMYIIPDQWGIKLCKNLRQQSQIQDIFNSEQQHSNKLSKLLKIFTKKQNNQLEKFKNVIKALFYLELESSFYSYLGLLKSLLLNKVSGIFNGDYETWQQVYDICLKIYARKQNYRGQNGVQIDQIIQNQVQDPQFTNFLMKSKVQTLDLSTINFYYKNCPKAAKNNLKNTIKNKISYVLSHNQFKQYEDISEYLDTQANQEQKKWTIQQIRNAFVSILDVGLKRSQYYQAHKAIVNLVQYLIKYEQSYFKVFNIDFFSKVLQVLHEQKQSESYNVLVSFIYSLINTIMIQCYQQQFDFSPYVIQHGEYEIVLKKIVVKLKKTYNLQIHEDACSIISEFNKVKKEEDSQSQDDEKKEKKKTDQELQCEEQFDQLIANLMIVSGRDCQFKLQNCLNSEEKKQVIANQMTRIFKKLSNSQFQQRSQIEKYLANKNIIKYTKEQKLALRSFLIFKGFKDRLLHQNIMNLSVKMHPVISFAQVATFAVEFISFMTPAMIDEPLSVGSLQNYANVEPFDVCDVVSGEQPIQCMKLIYKKVLQYEQTLIDFEVFNKIPFELLKNFGTISNNRSLLAKQIVQSGCQLTISMLDQMEELKKFLFYAELMNKVFSKLNQKSQKGIKQIKIIFNTMEKICVKIWQYSSSKIVSSQIYSICSQSQQFHEKLLKMNELDSPKSKKLTSQATNYSQITFNRLIKLIKLPYTDSVFSQGNYITKICQQFVCFTISKTLYPLNFFVQYQKLFNPLEILKIEQIPINNSKISLEFRQNYELIGQVVKALAMIEYTCSNEEVQQNREKQDQKEWSNRWRKNCLQISSKLIEIINKSNERLILDTKNETRSKSLWVSVFLVHLKAEIIKILVPYLIKDPLKYPMENPKNYNTQLQQTFSIFSSLCEIVQKISPGEEDHLMTFLQIFQNFDTGSNKNIQSNSRMSQFLYKAIQSLLGLVFKGIRVRSYHFYKFIKSYLKLTKQKQNYYFFNSVIGFYIEKLMKDIVPSFKLPETIINFCDQNLNSRSKITNQPQKQNFNKEVLINQNNLMKSVNKIRFSRFTRFQTKFQLTAEKVCVISMFMNLFCRLNFKTLTQGIEKIWETQQMHLVYLEYLKRISKLLSNEYKSADQKLFDIVNVDCFGNLSIILRTQFTNYRSDKQNQHHKLIQEILKLIKEVLRSNIKSIVKNSLKIPVKLIMSELKNSSTSIQTIDFISKVIQQLNLSKGSILPIQNETISSSDNNDSEEPCSQILDMILACYNIKLARGISSNVHINNLVYICSDSELKLRVLENNMSSLERRMSRKQIRAAVQTYSKKQQSVIKTKSRRSSINKKLKSQQMGKQESRMQTWVSISSHSQKLIKQIIQNFITSYDLAFRQETQKDNTQISNKDAIQTLFNNLKILSLVTLNNPQLVTYLMEYEVKLENNTTINLYQVMINSASTSLPVFVELYLVFLKTNFGFVYLEEQQKELMPNNFIIQTKIKKDLLNLLKKELTNLSKQKQKKIKVLLKTILTVTKLSNMTSKPSFRSYKFGNICNRKYTQIYAKYQQLFFDQLALTLKELISEFNSFHNNKQILAQNSLQLLILYEQTMNKVLKQSDLAWMKLDLDIQLGNIPFNVQNNSQKLSEKGMSDAFLSQVIQIFPKITYLPNQIGRSCNTLHSYSFQFEVINQEVYSFLHKAIINPDTDLNSSEQLLKKLMQFSAKQSVWEGVYDEDTVLQYPTNRVDRGSLGFSITSHDNNSSLNQIQNIRLNQNPVNSIKEVDNVRQDQIKQDQIKQNQLDQKDQIVEDLSQKNLQEQTINERRSHKNWGEMEEGNKFDGIIEDGQGQEKDFIVENHSFIQLEKCMSSTSLQFLSQHSVKIDQMSQKNSSDQPELQFTKQQLFQLYQQFSINPEGKKNLLNAISSANVMQLQKFIANQAVDEQIEMIVVRELWSRGIVPSATSISKNNKYYENLKISNKNTNQISIYISQALIYKRLHDTYSKGSSQNPTKKYIPSLSKEAIEYIIVEFVIKQEKKQEKNEGSLWLILNKLCLNPQNMYNLIEVILSYLSLSDTQISDKMKKILNKNNENECPEVNVNNFKLTLINNLISNCIKEKVGLKLFLTGYWNSKQSKITTIFSESKESRCIVPILLFILQESCLIQEIIKNKKQNNSHNVGQNRKVAHLVSVLWEYFQKCDQFKAHSKLQNSSRHEQNQYPYYQIQQSFNVSENFVKKIVERLFNYRTWVGDHKQQAKSQEISHIEELFMILIYIDPKSFQVYFKQIIDKISVRLSEILKKEQKILSSFQTHWVLAEKNFMEMQKQEKYWNLRQSKKSMSSYEEEIEYFRNILIDISVNLLPKFKKIRFSYHCGKEYRDWKLQLEIIKEKLLTSGGIQGLVKLQEKQKQLEDWRRNQSNQIIIQQIIPIVQEHTQQFLKVLMQAQNFIIEFVQTFQVKEHKQKIVIYNSCAKLYEILLGCEILTHQQKPTYHSMSKLKTSQSIESTKNESQNRRKSSLNSRRSVRISINSNMPKVNNILKKIGIGCTFLHNYIGHQEPIRELHAKYSDVNKRLKILWVNRPEFNPDHKPDRQKIIECRRTHVLEDTIPQIDEDFIALPVKIKFEGQIGIDYGGVTRQWITLFMKSIINPDLGLFSLSANKLTFQPNRNSYIIPNHLGYFRKIGILVGKAMKQNWLLQINLTKSFLKHVLGSTLYVQDLEDIDPQTAKSLKWILDNDIGYNDDLGLNFTYEFDSLGKKQTIQLIPDGKNIPITQQNKKEYVKMMAKVKMTEQIREQSKAFMNGLESVIPYSTLSLFSHKQISLYLSGMPTIDTNEMKQYARYENLTPQSQEVIWFWQIISQWKQQQLANLLFFLTGSYKVPYGGFKEQPIGFNKLTGCHDYLPVAHTCFSVIDISSYTSKEKMSKLLQRSVKQGKGFSIS